MRIYLQGILILIGIICLNWLATQLHLPSWYSFFQDITLTNFVSRALHLQLLSALWLLIGYPLCVGFIAHLAVSVGHKK